MKNLLRKLRPGNRERLKRILIKKAQHWGLAGLSLVLRALIRVLYGKKSWRNFDSISTVKWEVPSYRYYIHPDKIAGIDAALKENLSPGEALDKVAREFGVPEDEIKPTTHLNVPSGPWIDLN